jgi:hypothetical protein
MAEQTFFNEGGVLVTNARFVSQGQTHAISGITSVKRVKTEPSKKGPVILIVIAILAILGAIGSGGASKDVGTVIFMVLLLIGGIAWFLALKPTFYVVLSSASGEQKAHYCKDVGAIEKIVEAINNAIIARG